MSVARFIRLAPEEDAQLREVEQNPQLRAKIRLRAQVLRLSNQGWKVESIAQYTGRSTSSIYRDFDRWQAQSFAGLADGSAPGNPAVITQEVKAFLHQRLQEQRAWNGAQLADEVAQHFGIVVDQETIRRHLQGMGYRWKRSRYIPARAPDPQEEHQAKVALETLKRGLEQDGYA